MGSGGIEEEVEGDGEGEGEDDDSADVSVEADDTLPGVKVAGHT